MSLPYFPMYPTDFEADTSHLTLEEDGAYNRLMRLMWLSPGCTLPDDPAWIARRMRIDLATYERLVVPLIEEFFSKAKGRIFQKRLLKEFVAATDTHKKRSDAAKKRVVTRNALKDNNSDASRAHAGQTKPEPEPELDTDVSNNKAPPKPSPRSILSTALDDERTQAVIEHRKAIRAPLRERAAQLLAKEFEAIASAGGDPNDAADYMVLKGWRAIKADWYLNAFSRPAPRGKSDLMGVFDD